MSRVSFDDRWQYNGCRVLRLESPELQVDVLPDCGGRIFNFIHRPSGRNLLWHNPRIGPAVLPTGTNYDDNFAGGWDELFPNGEAFIYQGESYPDHGEYWNRPCRWDLGEDPDGGLVLHLVSEGPVTPTRLERWMSLEAGRPAMKVRYKITNRGDHPIDFNWTLHPALAVAPQSVLCVPPAGGVIGSPGSGRLAAEAAEFTWPMVPGRDGKLIDWSRVPTEPVPGFEMLFITQLSAGWYALVDQASKTGFALAFDREVFDTLWLFRTHGGWRGQHLVLFEPSTGYPWNLGEAVKSGRARRLEAGQEITTSVVATATVGAGRVTQVGRDGHYTME